MSDAAWRKIDVSGQHALAVLGFMHLHITQTVQTLYERPCETGRHMLGDQDGRRVGGHGLKHLTNGFGASGRGTNDNQLFRRRKQRLETPRRCGDAWGDSPWTRAGQGGSPDLVSDEVAVLEKPVSQSQTGLGHEIDGAKLEGPNGDFGVSLGKR